MYNAAGLLGGSLSDVFKYPRPDRDCAVRLKSLQRVRVHWIRAASGSEATGPAQLCSLSSKRPQRVLEDQKARGDGGPFTVHSPTQKRSQRWGVMAEACVQTENCVLIFFCCESDFIGGNLSIRS